MNLKTYGELKAAAIFLAKTQDTSKDFQAKSENWERITWREDRLLNPNISL